MRLWIIGNGFDLYHGLKTSYADYKAYLCQQKTCKIKCGRIKADDLPHEVCKNCCKVTNDANDCPVRKFYILPRENKREDLWLDVEEACSINIEKLLERHGNWWKHEGEPTSEPAFDVLLHGDLDFAKGFMATYLSRWIKEVNDGLLDICSSKRLAGIEKEDLFLTFNYTQTLEVIYGIASERIFYVHGQIKDVEEQKKIARENGWGKDEGDIARSLLAFGSPDLSDETINKAIDGFVESHGESRNVDVEEVRHLLHVLIGSLKKDVQGNVDSVRKFIGRNCRNCLSVDEVVVAGHSLGRIDRPYFEYLADYFKCMKWRFLFHSEKDIKKAFEFCRKFRLDGCCVPWNCSQKTILGGVPSRDLGGVRCPGFSVCWPNKCK